MRPTRKKCGSCIERSPSEHINGFDKSALISTGMNIASTGVRSPTRTCLRSVTLTRADVLALLTSLNCILSLASWMQRVPRLESHLQNPVVSKTLIRISPRERSSRRYPVDRVQALDLLWRATGVTDQILETMIDDRWTSGSKRGTERST